MVVDFYYLVEGLPDGSEYPGEGPTRPPQRGEGGS